MIGSVRWASETGKLTKISADIRNAGRTALNVAVEERKSGDAREGEGRKDRYRCQGPLALRTLNPVTVKNPEQALAHEEPSYPKSLNVSVRSLVKLSGVC